VVPARVLHRRLALGRGRRRGGRGGFLHPCAGRWCGEQRREQGEEGGEDGRLRFPDGGGVRCRRAIGEPLQPARESQLWATSISDASRR
jgi:hypothetical protein